MNSVESVANSRRVWYDHLGKLLAKVVTPKMPGIASSYQIERMQALVKMAEYIVFQLANSKE